MQRKLLRRSMAALAVSICVAGTTLAAQQPANASVSCYGDYCSGQDPVDTGCANDARTVSSTDLKVWSAGPGNDGYWKSVGMIELRWSPTCKTNWARASLTDWTNIVAVDVQQDTGYSQSRRTYGFWTGTPASVYYTPMIYSPEKRCYAYVEGDTLEARATDWV